jgi:hypothetical protein
MREPIASLADCCLQLRWRRRPPRLRAQADRSLDADLVRVLDADGDLGGTGREPIAASMRILLRVLDPAHPVKSLVCNYDGPEGE